MRAVVEVTEEVAGDVEGVGDEVHLVVAAGAVVGGEEFADDGVEGVEPAIGGSVTVRASPEAVDPGSEVEGVGRGLHWSVLTCARRSSL
ncbi:MAG: hypothetical protein OXI41_00875 [Chloroflexota bacterium]|nr:hypothetical protein [Chloroflexota bacterium]MDE2896201.1 hypothetical protein [Chloroflexota bacterium]